MYKFLAWYLKGYKNLDAIMKQYRKINDFETFCKFIRALEVDDRNRVISDW